MIDQLLHKFMQMLLMGFMGTSPLDEGVQEITRHIENGLGGVILFYRNVSEGPEKLKALIHTLKTSSKEQPLFVAIDGEGGNGDKIYDASGTQVGLYGIKRLLAKDGYQEFLPPEEEAQQYPRALKECARQKAAYLKSLGFNMNLAPSVDVKRAGMTTGCLAPFKRLLSTKPAEVIQFAQDIIEGHRLEGMITSIKHWPGLGGDRGDTHKEATKTDVTDEDLKVFDDLKDVAPMIMISHTITDKVDPLVPASLSEKTGQILEDRGHKEMRISDCLLMGGAEGLSLGERAIAAILAGTDILIFARPEIQKNTSVNDDKEACGHTTLKVMSEIIKSIKEALEKNDEKAKRLRKRIEESYERVVAFKRKWLS